MTTEQIVLDEIRNNILKLPEPIQLRVAAIAMTLRSILSNGEAAKYAFALVGAEEAAKP